MKPLNKKISKEVRKVSTEVQQLDSVRVVSLTLSVNHQAPNRTRLSIQWEAGSASPLGGFTPLAVGDYIVHGEAALRLLVGHHEEGELGTLEANLVERLEEENKL